jgi:hypothetical protein
LAFRGEEVPYQGRQPQCARRLLYAPIVVADYFCSLVFVVVVALVLDELKMVNFVIESWTYLAIDLVIVFGRSFARWKTFGLRGLAWDDFLMVVAVVGLTF